MSIFWLITCEEFFQIWGLHRKIENYKIFYYKLLPAKSNDKTFESSKNCFFFSLKNRFQEKLVTYVEMDGWTHAQA